MIKKKRVLWFLLFLFASWLAAVGMAEAALPNGKTSPKKGAGGAGDRPPEITRALGISWSYSWWVQREYFNQVYEYVPMVHKGMNLTNIQNVARDFPGRYWLVFNEPDFYYSDNITPTDGAVFYKQVRDVIKQADPTAKLIVGGCFYEDLGWLSQFRSEYKRLYGIFPPVEGWHAHLYVGTQNYNKDVWRQKITYWKTWMINNGGIKEFWLTEFGCLQSDAVSAQIMQDQVPWLESEATWITRYAWYAVWVPFENNPYCTQCRTSLTNESGGLTYLGDLFSTFGQSPPSGPYTITATAANGGDIRPSGSVNVASGGSQTFTITPNAGYRVADVMVDGISIGAVTTKTFTSVSGNHSIAASFAASTYTLSIGKNGTGSGNVSTNPEGSSFNAGTTITLSAASDPNSTFAGWSGGCTGTLPACQVTINSNLSVTAAFNLKGSTYIITATAEANGSISPSGSVVVSSGSSKTFTINPNDGYAIADVKVNSISKGAISSYTFSNVGANQSISATFTPVAIKQYILTTGSTGNGRGNVTSNPPGATFNTGTVVTLKAVANTGSVFSGWSGDCGGTSPSCSLVMNGNKTVTAKFLPLTLERRVTSSQKGTVVDLDGDGRDDVVWFDANTGHTMGWYISNGKLSVQDLHRDVNEANWRMVGGGNLASDGSYNIFWHNEATGKVYAWFMNRGVYLGEQYIRTIEDLQWKMVGVGDFDGDGNVDLLWHHQGTGAVYIWFMKGLIFVSDQPVATIEDVRWQVIGVGDWNGDGKADLLWQHPDGGPIYIWYMEGARMVRDQYVRSVEDLDWRVIGIGRFSNSPTPNILWRHEGSGERYIWYLEGGQYLGDARIEQ